MAARRLDYEQDDGGDARTGGGTAGGRAGAWCATAGHRRALARARLRGLRRPVGASALRARRGLLRDFFAAASAWRGTRRDPGGAGAGRGRWAGRALSWALSTHCKPRYLE